MSQKISSTQKAYLAGFLDGDGSIYVQLKPNSSYRYKFQVAPYIVLFQSLKDKPKFLKICSLIELGYIRERSDGILEYIIGKTDNIKKFLAMIFPYIILKKEQASLMIKILEAKKKVKNKKDFTELMKLIDRFRNLNYSKKRKNRLVTP